jgi:TonB family protein
MKPLNRLCSLFALALASLAVSPVLFSQQETAPKTSQPNTLESYPNTADGLHRLLNDLLLAAKNDDQTKLWTQIAEMEIPDYESWFTRTFGQEKGQAMAQEYQKSLKVNELQFEMLWTELAKQEGEISINRLDRENRKFDLAKKDDTLTNLSEEFKADWKKTDTSVGPSRQSVGYFCFVDGKYRLKSLPREIQILSTAKPGPLVAARLINKVQPVYPEVARRLRIQGTVAVNVIVHKDGTVTVQNVGAGHPLLAPAAVKAVQQWLYEPTTINGEPVEVETKVYVSFALSNQPNQQK